jgi:hypothetical protein
VRRYAEAFAPFRSLAADVRSIGLATAYATPPIVCQGLSALFAQRDRSATATKPRRILACEAPFALVLELLATKQVSVPGDLMLLTPGIGAVEMTSLRLTAEGGDLRIAICNFLEIPTAPGELPKSFLHRLNAFYVASDLTGASRIATAEALTAQPPAASEPSTLYANPWQVVPDEAIAWGAARYAAIHDKVPSGTGFRGLSIERLAARPAGIVGSNRAGAGAWRMLYSAGQSYEEPIPALIAPAAAGGVLVLAELARATQRAPLWLSQADWETAELVVHATCRAPRPSSAGPQSLQLKRSRPSGLCIWSGNEFSAQWTK